ncbi:DDE superfamily endonuclease [Popillia japonica]|uniref:DDE superfamily endonuclease n=1 Tax=Popillia japonica TaxID=7064 RepID=A0AAW1JZM6_POPJA
MNLQQRDQKPCQLLPLQKNARRFIPPATIMKGKYKKAEFKDSMPPDAVLFMSHKSPHINSELFMNWLKDHFLPRKPYRKVLLVLDRHSTHCSSVEMLEFADSHYIRY